MGRIAHIAVPCRDLEETKRFYEQTLGCRIAREYDDRLTLEFFGAQLVCHLSPEDTLAEPKIYPRHFGITFTDEADFDGLLACMKERDADFFSPPFVRFAGKREEHRAFFLKDPSNNLIEFKWYRDPTMAY